MSEHNQFLKDQSFEAYQSEEGVSATMLDYIRQSPAHLKAYMSGEIEVSTPATNIGTLIHAAALTPDIVMDSFYTRPEGMKFTTKDGVAWRDAHQDKPIISADEAKIVSICRDRIWQNPDAKEILSNGYAEQSCIVEDANGTKRKSRFDYISFTGNLLPDVKTTRDASPDEFSKAINKFQYSQRAAYYLDNAKLAGIEKDYFVFICVETSAPFNVVCYKLDPLCVEYGHHCVEHDLAVYRECVASGKWPGYKTDLRETIALPGWMMRQITELV